MKRNFGTRGAKWEQGNFDGDGDVDYADLQMLMNNFGNTSPAPSAQTPKPATGLLFSALSLPVLMNRRNKR